MQPVTVFIAQFALVMLLGLQSLNVNGGHPWMAAGTSLGLGASGYYLTAVIADASLAGTWSAVWWAYVLSGPCGIVTAMRLHPWLKRRLIKV